ncbi:hypothetical protein RhiirA5_348804, partial [Rhizophagus irregularis]
NVRNDGPAANLEINSELINSSDDEITEPWLENDFGDVTHPANDTNIKCDLITLFNNNII